LNLRKKGREERRGVSPIAPRERRCLPKKRCADKYLRQNGAASLGSLYLAVIFFFLKRPPLALASTLYYPMSPRIASEY
jgi:hypothetical protein